MILIEAVTSIRRRSFLVLIASSIGVMVGGAIATRAPAIYGVEALIRNGQISIQSHQGFPGNSGILSELAADADSLLTMDSNRKKDLGLSKSKLARALATAVTEGTPMETELLFRFGRGSQSAKTGTWLETVSARGGGNGFLGMELRSYNSAAQAEGLAQEILIFLQNQFRPTYSQFRTLTERRLREVEALIRTKERDLNLVNRNLELLGHSPLLRQDRERVIALLIQYRSSHEELSLAISPANSYNFGLVGIRPIDVSNSLNAGLISATTGLVFAIITALWIFGLEALKVFTPTLKKEFYRLNDSIVGSQTDAPESDSKRISAEGLAQVIPLPKQESGVPSSVENHEHSGRDRKAS